MLGDLETSDALDGHIVIHEYAHAWQHKVRGAVPGWVPSPEITVSEQAMALLEGHADFAASSYFGSARFGEYRAHMLDRLFLRNVDNFLRWPKDFVEGDAYRTAMIFSGALWDLRAVVGPQVAERLALRTVQMVPDREPGTPEFNATFDDALDTMLQVDADLYGGTHRELIRQAFAVHGIGTYDFSTPFPMVREPGNDYEGVETYSLPGATVLAVTFDQFVTKLDDAGFTKDRYPRPGFDEKSTTDYLELMDALGTVVGAFTGRELQGTTVVVPGDTVMFRLVTDSYREPFGYRVVAITPVVPGDANLDGQVGIADLSVLADHYGQTGATWMQGDFNFDGGVGVADLGAIADNYDRTLGPADDSVPEPTALLLLLAGGLVLVVRRCRGSA